MTHDQITPPITLTLDSSRRLTGSSLFMTTPGAILDAFVSGLDKQQVIDTWLAHVAPLLNAVGWGNAARAYRIHEQGISVGFSAPWDGLYAATEINEMAWESACDALNQSTPQRTLEEAVTRANAWLDRERNPALVALIQQADERGVPMLFDDEVFSLGYGQSTQCWEMTALPSPEEIDWTLYTPVPLALVTGTNGKSTSVRLTAHIFNTAGQRCGITSTDFIKVGTKIIDRGDYSGPSGARTLLRQPEVDVAILEVARGGLLRRGLPVPHADVALVTNIADDHLGHYGIYNIEALTAVKMLVAQAALSGQVIINADDPHLVNFIQQTDPSSASAGSTSEGYVTYVAAQEPRARVLPDTLVWFSLDETNPKIQTAKAQDTPCCFVRDGQIVYGSFQNGQYQEHEIVAIKDIPMTLQGAALHNVRNALGAVAISKALGVDDPVIAQALSSFESSPTDNPGRGNIFTYRGATFILDFAHNTHGMQAMAHTLKNLPAGRRIITLCHAGDRSDQQITDLTRTAMSTGPDLVWVCETRDLLRGRELGEVPALMKQAVLESGIAEAKVHYADSPLNAAEQIIAQLQPGDLVFMMALSQRDEIMELLG